MYSYHQNRRESRRSYDLPGEEYRRLEIRRKIEAHYAGGAVPSNMPVITPYTKYRSARLIEKRLQESKIRFATRKALGPSFDFTDESLVEMAHHRARVRTHQAVSTPDQITPIIPPQYQAEFGRRHNEDDQRYDNEQYMADVALHDEAASRHHLPAANSPTGPGTIYDTTDMVQYVQQYQATCGRGSCNLLPPYTEDSDGRPVPMMDHAVKPLKSSFDWSDDSDNEDENESSKGWRKSLLDGFRRPDSLFETKNRELRHEVHC